MPAEKPSRREIAMVTSAFAAMAALLTWPLAARIAAHLPGDLADPLLNAFTLAWDADRMRDGLQGLWHAPFFFPLSHSLLRSEHLLGIALFTAPLQWATSNPVLVYNVAFLGSSVLAGVGAHLLARELFHSRAAAWVAAAAFAFAPYRVAHVSHLQLLVSGWTPLALWGLHRYFAAGSRAALAAAAGAFALQALSCGYLMYFSAVPIAIAALAGLSGLLGRSEAGTSAQPVRAGRVRRQAIHLALAAAAVAVVLAPIALGYLELRREYGFSRSTREMLLFSARASDYWAVSRRLWLWGSLLGKVSAEHALFPGLATAILAVGGLATAVASIARPRWKRCAAARPALLYGVILAVSVWLSFGPSLPVVYEALVTWLPGFNGLRVPARFVVIVSLAASVLAGGAVASVTRGWRPRRAAALAVALVALIALEGYGGAMPVVAFDPLQRDRRDLNAWLRAAPPGGVLELPVAGPEFRSFTTTYQYNVLLHGHPLVNGYSGSGYALQDFLAAPGSPIDDPAEAPDILRALQSIGVRYVVLHGAAFDSRPPRGRPPASRVVEAFDAAIGQVASRARFGDSHAWRLANGEADPAPSGAFPRVPLSDMRVSASTSPAQIAQALDGNVSTHWSSERDQEGSEQVEIAFGRPIDVAALVLRSDRHGGSSRPRRLLVESPQPDGSREVLFEGSILPQILRGLVRQGSADAVIELPPNRSTKLVLRQLASARGWRWSIHELQVHERRGSIP